VFTTSVLSVSPQRPTIALFFTGVAHAGENLCRVLQQQMEELAPPVQMCDALARNLPKDLETIVAHCLSHARRKFVERGVSRAASASVPQGVYRTMRLPFHLSDELRLQLHQRVQRAADERVARLADRQLEQRRVAEFFAGSSHQVPAQPAGRYLLPATRCAAFAPIAAGSCHALGSATRFKPRIPTEEHAQRQSTFTRGCMFARRLLRGRTGPSNRRANSRLSVAPGRVTRLG
jgi:hypothetical protein